MKVLFITSNPLGDAVLTTGLLDHIINRYPGCEITVACGPLPAAIFRNVPGLKQIITMKKLPHGEHWLNLWKKVCRTRWDLVVDLRNSIVSRLVVSREIWRFGRHIDRSLHKVEQNAAVMKLATVPEPRLWISDEQRERASSLIPSGGPVIGVGPTANWQGKIWPPGCFIDLLAGLIRPEGLFPFSRIAVFGAPGEENQARPVIEAIPDELLINLVGKTDPAMAAAALERCTVYIGNDSGLMHLSAAAGTPTVGLFGPSYPHLYRPWGAHCTYVRTPETYDELTGYEGYTPETAPCLMASLTAEAALKEMARFWNRQH